MAGRPTSERSLGARFQALRAHLDTWLFPAAPAGASTLGRWEGALLATALLAIAVVAQLLRVGASDSLESLWAEDGQIFVQGTVTSGFWHAVSSTYAGYLVVVPRLIGEVGAAAPLRDTAAAVAITSGIVVALSGLAVWFASAGLIRNPYLRGTLAALTVLTPVAGLESIASGAYVPWYMLFATFWLLLWRPRTTLGAVLAGLFILLTGLSSPGLWFFAPLAALRAIAVRDRRDLLIVGSFALGAAVQVPVIALNDEAKVQPLWSSDIWTTYVQRVVDGAAFGEHLGGAAWAHLGWPFLIALLAGAGAGLVFGLLRSTASARYMAAIAIPTSLVMFVVSVYQRAVGSAMMWPADIHFGDGGRYAIVPALLLVSVALVLVDQSTRKRSGPSWLPWAGMATVAVLLVGLAASFDVSDSVVRGTPPWKEGLEQAATTCAAEGGSEGRVATSPPNFGISIPCDRLAPFAPGPPG